MEKLYLTHINSRQKVFKGFEPKACDNQSQVDFRPLNTKFNPQAPVAQRVADEVVFRRFFRRPRWRSRVFLIGRHWPPQIFDAHLLENTNLSPSSFHFSVGFYITIMFWVRWFYSLFERMRSRRKKMFIHTNHPLITSFYIKKVPIFCRISDESALSRNPLRNGRVRGKPIGHLRVKRGLFFIEFLL